MSQSFSVLSKGPKSFFSSGSIINYGKRGELSKAIADSNNNGFGTPAPISTRQYLTLIDTLRFQKKL